MTDKAEREPLIIDDQDRYSRFRLIGWWDQEKIQKAKVLVVGAGALGNEVLKNLALLGVGHIINIDYDDIEDSNLTRSVLYRARDNGRFKVEAAAEAIKDINPDVKVEPIVGNVLTDLGLGLFKEMDVVFGCLDNREARLWVNRCCWKTSTPWVDGGIQVISGVVSTFTPPDSACYECKMSEMDYKLINLKYSCPLLKREDLLQGKTPTAPTVASIVGALQVQEMLKIIHGIDVNGGSALMMSGEVNSFYTSRFQRREDCLSHETYPEPIEHQFGHDITLGEFFKAVKNGGEGPLSLHLERDVLRELFCPQCDYRKEVYRPLTSVSLEEGKCPTCEEVCQTDIVHLVSEEDEKLLDQPLASLGVPKYEILKVQAGDEMSFHLLAKDRDAAFGAAK